MSIDSTTADTSAAEHGLPAAWLEMPFSDYLHMSRGEDDDGEFFSLMFKDEHLGNPLLNTFHGGVIATFVESCAQIHLAALGRFGVFPLAETVTVDYLRPAIRGELRARPSVVRMGASVATIQVAITREAKVVATGRVIFCLNRDADTV